MTQRIFDVENEKDMTDLWDLLPENGIKIKKSMNSIYFDRLYRDNGDILAICILKINWHNKTEIVRPIQEATEVDIGKICEFWDNQIERTQYKQIGVLTRIKDPIEDLEFKYELANSVNFKHCRRLTKQEIEELC